MKKITSRLFSTTLVALFMASSMTLAPLATAADGGLKSLRGADVQAAGVIASTRPNNSVLTGFMAISPFSVLLALVRRDRSIVRGAGQTRC